jgi:hypothetical protein
MSLSAITRLFVSHSLRSEELVPAIAGDL